MSKRFIWKKLCLAILATSALALVACETTKVVPFPYTDAAWEVKDLAAPTPHLNGGTVYWDTIEHASDYEIYVDGEKVATTKQLAYTLELTDYDSYNINVKAIGDPAYWNPSPLSATLVYEIIPVKLSAPELVVRGYDVIWKPVDGAVGYTVYVDDTKVEDYTEEDINTTDYNGYFVVTLTKASKVAVVAKAENSLMDSLEALVEVETLATGTILNIYYYNDDLTYMLYTWGDFQKYVTGGRYTSDGVWYEFTEKATIVGGTDSYEMNVLSFDITVLKANTNFFNFLLTTTSWDKDGGSANRTSPALDSLVADGDGEYNIYYVFGSTTAFRSATDAIAYIKLEEEVALSKVDVKTNVIDDGFYVVNAVNDFVIVITALRTGEVYYHVGDSGAKTAEDIASFDNHFSITAGEEYQLVLDLTGYSGVFYLEIVFYNTSSELDDFYGSPQFFSFEVV